MGGVWQNCCCGGGFRQLQLLAALPNCGENYNIGPAPGEPNPGYDRLKRFKTLTVVSGFTGSEASRFGVADYNSFARDWRIVDPQREEFRAGLAALIAARGPADEARWSEEYTPNGITRIYGLDNERGGNWRPLAWESVVASNQADWDTLAAEMAGVADTLWGKVAADKSVIFMWIWNTDPGHPVSSMDGTLVPFEQRPLGGDRSLYTVKARAGVSDTAPFDPIFDPLPRVPFVVHSHAFFGFFAFPIDGAGSAAESGFVDLVQVRLNPGTYCCQNWRQEPDYGPEVFPNLESGDYRYNHWNGIDGGHDGKAGWIYPEPAGAVDAGRAAETTAAQGLIREPSSYWGIKEVFYQGGGPC